MSGIAFHTECKAKKNNHSQFSLKLFTTNMVLVSEDGFFSFSLELQGYAAKK